jgi:hypothetical protein
MAILGYEGFLNLKRETSADITLTPLSFDPAARAFRSGLSDLWSGDKVALTSPVELPVADLGSGGIYGDGIWDNLTWDYELGYQNITSTDPFWDEAPEFPWADTRTIDLGPKLVYVHVDQLGLMRFYDNWTDAFNGDPVKSLPLRRNNFKTMLIVSQEHEWSCVSDLKDYSLELEAPAVDVTGIGMKFGESVKSLVTGGGQLSFMVEHRQSEDNDPVALARLLLMTERGCKAYAQFWVLANRPPDNQCQREGGARAAGDLYYEADLLIAGMSLNIATENYIAGAAQFVTTGEIRLRVGMS